MQTAICVCSDELHITVQIVYSRKGQQIKVKAPDYELIIEI